MKLAVLGAGSWGSALSAQLARCGHEVRLWVREPGIAAEINAAHTNAAYLPGIELPAGIQASTDMERAVAGVATAVLVVPSQYCREVLKRFAAVAPSDCALVSATKGLETDTLLRISQVASAERGAGDARIAVLSGPSFALEVARETPTALVVAAADPALAESLQRAFSSRAFRVYASSDVVGVELGGALKNVIAIAAGIVAGLGHGHNTAAALITRGLAEISRLAIALGGRAETLSGLAGLGDLVLTCTGSLSRNRALGEALGRGQSLAAAQAASPMVAEGVRTTLAACELAARAGIEMPIAQQMRAALYEGKPPRDAVDELMLRSLKRE